MAEYTNCDTSCETCSTGDVAIPTPNPDDKLTDPGTIGFVTEEAIDGKGVFDSLMRAGSNQLMTQYEAGRIKGKEFADAYLSMMELMMTQANAFVIQSYTAKLDAESKFKMFPYNALSMIYDAAIKEAQAREMDIKNKLVCTQINELVLNGSQDRALKASQIEVQDAQRDLYVRQTTGFNDKRNNDNLKVVMDSWAVQAVELPDDSPALIDFLEVNGSKGAINTVLTNLDGLETT